MRRIPSIPRIPGLRRFVKIDRSTDLADELRSTARELDPAALEPAVLATAATAHWLATNPGDVDRPEHAVREGVRLFFAGDPPPEVADWLEGRGLA